MVLYVDDNVDELLIFEAACRIGRVGFDARTVEGSAEGLAWLEGRGTYADRLRYPFPDLVVLDIKMAGADGFQLLERLRGDPAMPRVPVVLLTSSVLPDDARRALARGAAACLSKPVEITRTIELVREMDAGLAHPDELVTRLGPYAVR